ncbi:hypothetical protein A4X06_0g347 [Tilletia controversa]|uniref:Ubiquitin-like protease family profile domain-containing protein n=1 Tax=Tilletia controversa TaxID=13291 RepID=A0A8X7T0V1_9BASI|nr:hypothetical protein A4X06_0g347 [Tilletia controversa]
MSIFNNWDDMSARNGMHGNSHNTAGRYPRPSTGQDQHRNASGSGGQPLVPNYGIPPIQDQPGARAAQHAYGQAQISQKGQPPYGVTPRSTASPYVVPMPPKNTHHSKSATPFLLGQIPPGTSGSGGSKQTQHSVPYQASGPASRRMGGRASASSHASSSRPTTSIIAGQMNNSRRLELAPDGPSPASQRNYEARGYPDAASTGATTGSSRLQPTAPHSHHEQFKTVSTQKRKGWSIGGAASSSPSAPSAARVPSEGKVLEGTSSRQLVFSEKDPSAPTEVPDSEDEDAADSRTRAVKPSPAKGNHQNPLYMGLGNNNHLLNPLQENGQQDDSNDPIDMLPPRLSTQIKGRSMQPDVAMDDPVCISDSDTETRSLAKSEPSRKRPRVDETSSSTSRLVRETSHVTVSSDGEAPLATNGEARLAIAVAGVAEKARAQRPGTSSRSESSTSPLIERLQLNGGRGMMKNVERRQQDTRQKQRAQDDYVQYDSDTGNTTRLKNSKRANPKDEAGSATATTFTFDHFFVGEEYIPGPHKIAFEQHAHVQLKLKQSKSSDGDSSLNFDPSQLSTVTRAKSENRSSTPEIPFFHVEWLEESPMLHLVKKLSMNGQFDTMASEKSARSLCGLIRPDNLQAFAVEWEKWCNSGFFKSAKSNKSSIHHPHFEYLDRAAINTLKGQYESQTKMKTLPMKRAKPMPPASSSVQEPIAADHFFVKSVKDSRSILMERARQQPLPDIPKKGDTRSVSNVPSHRKKVDARSVSEYIQPPRSSARIQTRRQESEDSDMDINDLVSASTAKASADARVARAVRGKARITEADDTQILRWPIRGGPGAISLFPSDFAKLDEGEFLNDTLIEFGLKYILDQKRDEGEAGARLAEAMYLYSSFFYKRLSEGKDHLKLYENVRKWTSRVDIFQKDYLIVPINEHLHWYLAIIVHPRLILKRKAQQEQEQKNSVVRRSKRHSTTVPDSEEEYQLDDDDESEPIIVPKRVGNSGRKTPDPGVAGTESSSDSVSSAAPETSAQRSRAMSVDEISQGSEENVLVDMEHGIGRAEDGIAKKATMVDSVEELTKMSSDAAIGTSQDGGSAATDDEGPRRQPFTGLLSQFSHPDLKGFFQPSQNQPTSAATNLFQAGRSAPLASTPPQQTRVRAEHLLNSSSTPRPANTKVGDHSAQGSLFGRLGPSQTRDGAEPAELNIKPTTITMTSLQLSDDEDAGEVEADLGTGMDIDSPKPDSGEPMDQDMEEEFSFVGQKGPYLSPSARQAFGRNQDANVDTSSCINNPGRGKLVGGSGSGSTPTGRVPVGIRPGEMLHHRRSSGVDGRGRDRSPGDASGILKPPSAQNSTMAGTEEHRRPRARPLQSGSESNSKAGTSTTTTTRTRSHSGKRREYDETVPTIIFFDSLLNPHRPAGIVLTRYLKYEAMDKKRDALAEVGLTWEDDDPDSKKKVLEELPDCNLINAIVPEQPNSCDCGVYLLYFVRRFFSDPLRFEKLIAEQYKDGDPLRENFASPEWNASEGPKQRRFWQDTIDSHKGAWTEQHKIEEEAAELRKQTKRAAEAAAAESGEGTSASGPSKNRSEDVAVAEDPNALDPNTAQLFAKGLRPRASAPAKAGTSAGKGTPAATETGSRKTAATPAKGGVAAGSSRKGDAAASVKRSTRSSTKADAEPIDLTYLSDD